MKKLLSALLACTLAVGALSGCASSGAASSSAAPAGEAEPSASPAAPSEASGGQAPAATTVTLKVGASPTPHAELLHEAAKLLEAQGIAIEVVEFTDYVQPNLALDSGELDANFFQHKPYLDNFNEENGTKLATVGFVHYEPLGLYAGKTGAIADLKEGAAIAVPNDTTNEARALLLLQDQGLIKLKEGAGVTATQTDITENPKNLKIQEIAAEQLARSLPDVDMAVINGNYAILGGLQVAGALAKEEKDSLAAQTYANVLVVRAGEEGRQEVKALLEALRSEELKQFMEEKYAGSVVPAA